MVEDLMKAAQFYGGKDIRVENVPDPTPALDQVLVKVNAAGICGSDLHGYHRQPEKPLSPRIGGHELTGEIIDIGKDVTTHKTGARVAIEPISPCNNCPECLNGYYNICSKLRHAGGGFAEYMVAATSNAYELPDNVSVEGGALAEVYAVAVHAVNRAMVSPGDHVAIIGSGPVGLTIAQVADVAGATSIAVLGKPDAPIQIAHEAVGAVPINVDKTDSVAAIMDWSDGRGADVVFEAVGGTANTLERATEIAAKRGRVCMVGGHGAPLTFSERFARSRELTIIWSFCYGRRGGKTEFRIAIDLLAAGKIDPNPLVTHRFGLDNISQAFAVAAGRDEFGSVKVLVTPNNL
ncbi:alcohol dehydrogenase catalytic domain-containing protein [Candidatus Poribacteria bacterium]|nr:alcohol dehydrogenase catalytic domain-containing protein [Candidatus Poribacteria bacterium]